MKKNIKTANIKQQVEFSFEETYLFSKKLIKNNPNMKALWLQGSDKYKAALQAISESKKEIYLLTFDAEPEFLELIPNKTLFASVMQQPFLMGEIAVETLDKYLKNEKVEKNIELSTLVISKKNIEEKILKIRRNVLGLALEE